MRHRKEFPTEVEVIYASGRQETLTVNDKPSLTKLVTDLQRTVGHAVQGYQVVPYHVKHKE